MIAFTIAAAVSGFVLAAAGPMWALILACRRRQILVTLRSPLPRPIVVTADGRVLTPAGDPFLDGLTEHLSAEDLAWLAAHGAPWLVVGVPAADPAAVRAALVRPLPATPREVVDRIRWHNLLETLDPTALHSFEYRNEPNMRGTTT